MLLTPKTKLQEEDADDDEDEPGNEAKLEDADGRRGCPGRQRRGGAVRTTTKLVST